MRLLLAICLLVIPTLAQAKNYSDLSTYYPLAEGNAWVYASESNFGGLNQFAVESYDKESAYYTVRHKNNLVDGLLIIEYKGDRIQKIGATSSVTGDIEPKIVPEIILMSPLIKGTKWHYFNNNYDIYCQVVGIVTTEVKAGKFNNVIKVEIMRKNKKKKENWPPEYQYFAPNVGLIKTEAKIKNKMLLIEELIDYTIKSP